MNIKTTQNLQIRIVISLLAISISGSCLASVKGDAGQIIYVDAFSDGGDGRTWETAYNSLQKALDDAERNMQIWVADGTYRPEKKVLGKTDRAKSFQLKSGVKLYAGFAGGESSLDERDWKTNKAILSGDLEGNDDSPMETLQDNSYHVLTGNGTDSTALIDGFYITAGIADAEEWPHDGGGGMNNEGGNLTVRNCTFYLNKGFADGGAVRNWGNCKPRIINTTFMYNRAAEEGGGMMSGPESQPIVIACHFESNLAGEDGGGMYNNITKNQIIANCVFINNHVGLTGGAMYNVNGSAPLITNCTFVNNTAQFGGGAISNRDSDPTIVNSVLTGNISPKGAEIYNLRSEPKVASNLIKGGYANGTNIIDADPKLSKEYKPIIGSPAIDAGDNKIVPSFIEFDFEGELRIKGARIDLGAFETQ